MKLLIYAALLISQVAFANSNDFGSSDGVKSPIPINKMRYQLEIKGEILVFDSTGKRLLYKGDEGRSWWFGDEKPIISNWSYRQQGLKPVALRHEWVLSPEGHLTATVKQYDSMERGSGDEPQLGKLLKEQVIQVENFQSISWVVDQDDKKRVVAKLEPVLWADAEPSDVGKLPINSGRMTIHDSRGNLWASRLDNADGTNIYYGVLTHMGALFISYVPFKGAKEIGTAKKNTIKIEDKGLKVFIESADPFLPRGVSAKVYGFVDLNRRTESVYKVRSFGSDDADKFLKRIK